MRIPGLRSTSVLVSTVLVLGTSLACWAASSRHGNADAKLTPQTHFTMQADGSSGLTVGGERIPDIDSVKKTVAAYYGDPGTGISNKTSSPYISQLKGIEQHWLSVLRERKSSVSRGGEKPAIVLDADDTLLATYDFEVARLHFNFDPAVQDVYVQAQRFPAVPGMVDFVNRAQALGYKVFGLTGRNDDQRAATVANLAKVGYRGFTSANFFTRFTGKGDSQQPSYLTCVSTCTTVEYKAGTRKHIEKDLDYRIVLDVGDQWSDLMGGYTDATLKLPNPTYYLPSPNLPGRSQPQLAPRTQFTMKPDGSSGLRGDGEGIPNIDSVKSTIRAYYGDTGDGTSNKTASPYIRQMTRITARQSRYVDAACRAGKRKGRRPAIVLDADDSTLWTYDLEAGILKFDFDPTVQGGYVQAQKFPAVPGMVRLVDRAHSAGCTLVGLTGRTDDQKAATIANLAKVGYRGFSASNYYTRWTGRGSSQQPPYIHCKAAACTTTEYKAQTRKHVEKQGYSIVADFGDQFSDLEGGYTRRSVKLPNPTYYLP